MRLLSACPLDKVAILLVHLSLVQAQSHSSPEACTNGDVRLVNGATENEGRVEFCQDSLWGTVCDDDWDISDATVVCRQLGYTNSNSWAYSTAFFGQGSGPIFLDQVACTGNETTLGDCSSNPIGAHDCSHFEDAGVSCHVSEACTNGDVRLVNGATENEGRVEFCQGNIWGTVCDDNWDNADATVVCRQLGYVNSTGLAYGTAQFGFGSGPIFLDQVACIGNEATLGDCSSNPIGAHDCSHFEDAGVSCQDNIITCTNGDVRLVNGATENEGRVEFCQGNIWGTVCDDDWDISDATVVCRQLGYVNSTGLAYGTAQFGLGSGPIFLDQVGCTGNEATLGECYSNPIGAHDCSHSEDAGVSCQDITYTCTNGDVRLVNGATENEGRVEFCQGNIWGTVCDDNWDNTDATVVCRQLGYVNSTSWAYGTAHFGFGSGPIFLDQVACTGNEATLGDCSSNPIGAHDCSHSEDAGVSCQDIITCTNGDVRLVGGATENEGRVEFCHANIWGTVCDDDWDISDATVVCRQLGFTNSTGLQLAYGTAQFGLGSGPIFLDQVGCTGNEATLGDCSSNPIGAHDCSHFEDAGVSCQGSCVNAGYTQCCEDEADCVGSLPGCFCDVSCHLRGDCCHDIHDTCSETPPPPLGSCREAGFTGCCQSVTCEGSSPYCYCDIDCHLLGDCCSDIDETCPIQDQSSTCAAAGYTSCCNPASSDCTGHPLPNCFCDSSCHGFNDCCEDINNICPATVEDGDTSEQYLVLATMHVILKNHDINNVEQAGPSVNISHFDTSSYYAGVDYDYRQDYLYYSDIATNNIVRSSLNGSSVETLAHFPASIIDDVAVDWVANNLYLTDGLNAMLQVLDLDTMFRTELIRTGANTAPRGIVIDPSTRYMYWSDWGEPAKIERASMDGSNREVLHDTDLRWPNGLAIDYELQRLYWVEAYYDKVEFSNVDGSRRETLLDLDSGSYPFTITISGDQVYWAEWSSATIYRTHKEFATSVLPVLTVPHYLHTTSGIEVVHPNRQHINSTNYCEEHLCSHICLLSSISSNNYTCACPHGFSLNQDGITCVVDNNATVTPPSSSGTCQAAGYTTCCSGGYCAGYPPTCYCHSSCTEHGDCCRDFSIICSPPTTATPTAITQPGVCEQAGYTKSQCCQDPYCLPLPQDAGCFCDVSCHLHNDCCEDINSTCTYEEFRQFNSSCTAAEHEICCEGSNCAGQPVANCYCDFDCHFFDDCCHDINDICSWDEKYLLLGTSHEILDIRIFRNVGTPLISFDDTTNYTASAIAVDYDYRRGYMYYSAHPGTIERAYLNGTSPQTLTENMPFALTGDVAVDWVANNLYFTDEYRTTLEVLDLDTMFRTELIRTGANTAPRGIVVDPSTRYMYWSDWGAPAKIERASMDGNNREVLHDTDLTWPTDLAIDYQRQKLYWVDSVYNKIEFSDVDGHDRRVLLSLDSGVPFSIAVSGNEIYWTELLNNTIYKAHNQLVTKILPVYQLQQESLENDLEIVYAHKQRNITNFCEDNPCSHICLLSSNSPTKYTCACPLGYALTMDETSCMDIEPTISSEGPCVAAGYTGCCVGGYCAGYPPPCSCGVHCTDFDSCCDDLPSICTLAYPVENLTAVAPAGSTTLLEVSWLMPSAPSGVVYQYHVLVTNYSLAPVADFIASSDMNFAAIDGLGPFIPYNVTVTAFNRYGNASAISVLNFTLEGVPPVPPANISAQKNDSSKEIHVTWELLTPEQALGFVENYTVSYSMDAAQHLIKKQSYEVTISGTKNSVVIQDVDPRHDYTVIMWATTKAGMGKHSNPILAKSESLAAAVGKNVAAIAGGLIGVVVACGLLSLILILTVWIVKSRSLRHLILDDSSPLSDLTYNNPLYDKNFSSIGDGAYDEHVEDTQGPGDQCNATLKLD